MELAATKGIKNAQKLSEYMNYKSPEKIYRLERDQNAKPNFQFLLDISKYFDNADFNYLVIGCTNNYIQNNSTKAVSEDEVKYSKADLFKELLEGDSKKVDKKLEVILNNQIKILDRLDRGILKDTIDAERKKLAKKKNES